MTPKKEQAAGHGNTNIWTYNYAVKSKDSTKII